MTSERDWGRDKDRFVAYAEQNGSSSGTGLHSVSPLVRQFADLTRSLLDASSIAGGLRRIVVAALDVVPGADVASVTLRGPDGTYHTPVETDPVAGAVDQLQYDTDEGPCVDAARMTGPGLAYSGDLATDPAWPRFGPLAAERGFGSLLSTTLLPDVRPPRLSGALNLYSVKPHGFTDADRDAALLLATHASLALATTRAVTTAELNAAHLRKAVDTRDVIGQAKGILMHRRGITADEAFDILRETSQSLNVKLADLASTLAARHGELDLP